MSDVNDEISVVINAPPSIEINVGQVVAKQPLNLTGVTDAESQNAFRETQPTNVNFVMGPNGQLIAVAKAPFVWKHFWIGGGIPFALYILPLLLMLIAGGFSEGQYRTGEALLIKEENSTRYSGEYFLESDHRLERCWINPVVETGNEDYNIDTLYCEVSGDEAARIRDGDAQTPNQVIGEWSGQNGTIYFDAGVDYGDTVFEIQFESQEDEGFLMEILHDAEEIMIFSCCFGFLLSIGLIIGGFSSGKPGMGWGGVAALAACPIVGILAATLA
mgnify:CR=1 FL=1|jgi:hypothetical protein